jgi:hypothetical protein
LVTQDEATDVGGEEGCGIEERDGAWSLVAGVKEEVTDTMKVEGRGLAASMENER